MASCVEQIIITQLAVPALSELNATVNVICTDADQLRDYDSGLYCVTPTSAFLTTGRQAPGCKSHSHGNHLTMARNCR